MKTKLKQISKRKTAVRNCSERAKKKNGYRIQKQKKKCSACIIDIEKIHSYLNDLKEPKKKYVKRQMVQKIND